MCLRVQIDYSSIYKELDSLLADKKPDCSAMVFNSVEELRIHNMMMKMERESHNYMGSRGAPECPESI